MSWTEEASKTCNDCGGRGGWSHRHRVTGRQVYDRCGRCDGHGEIAWGADPGPSEPDPDLWRDE
jgi:DnaJ-class molecular chaperone